MLTASPWSFGKETVELLEAVHADVTKTRSDIMTPKKSPWGVPHGMLGETASPRVDEISVPWA